MNNYFKIFNSGREQRLLDLLYGSRHERDEAVQLMYPETKKYGDFQAEKMGLSSEEAKDVLAESMLALLEAAIEKRIKERPESYLRKIIKFKSIDRLKKKKEMKSKLADMPDPNTDEDDQRKEAMELTAAAVKLMIYAMDFINPDYKALVEKFYFFKMSTQQIADEHGASYDTVKTQLSRARKALKDKIKELNK